MDLITEQTSSRYLLVKRSYLMILAGLLSGIIIGMMSAAFAALLGSGLLLALLAYVLGGTIGMVAVLSIMFWRQEHRTALLSAKA